ncbi:putative thymidylate synthase [Flavobacterium phage FPSV-S29]|nr:putative thymidylate synthase [Flavobacterium phage FPSV-S29]
MIKAEIVAHSKNQQGDELITVLCTFPRIILSEINTHRMLSKNTSSSRAIPFSKLLEMIERNPFVPIGWQKDHKGMQGTEYWEGEHEILDLQESWFIARDRAVEGAKDLDKNKVTKQLCNRLLEPFMWTTMLITGPKSGWDNFFYLRCPQYYFEPENKSYRSKKEWVAAWNGTFETGKDVTRPVEVSDWNDLFWLKQNTGQAEIHMMALAECIWDAYNESTPKQLKAGEWHIPFIEIIED